MSRGGKSRRGSPPRNRCDLCVLRLSSQPYTFRGRPLVKCEAARELCTETGRRSENKDSPELPLTATSFTATTGQR